MHEVQWIWKTINLRVKCKSKTCFIEYKSNSKYEIQLTIN